LFFESISIVIKRIKLSKIEKYKASIDNREMRSALFKKVKPETKELKSYNKKGTFKLQNKNYHLTYKTHIDEHELLDYLNSKNEVANHSIVQETSKDGYKHTHALISFKVAPNKTDARYFDYDGIHPNIVKVVGVKHIRNIVKYHQKDGVPVSSFEPVGLEVRETMRKLNTPGPLHDKLMKAENYKEASFMIAAHKFKEPEAKRILEKRVFRREWQNELFQEYLDFLELRRRYIEGDKLKEMEEYTVKRPIIWYYNHEGMAGKSDFAEALREYKGTFQSDADKKSDLATEITERINKSRDPKNEINLLIYDLSKCDTVKTGFYGILEAVKGRFVTGPKYLTCSEETNPAMVVVLSNGIPRFDMFSKDRWDLRLLDFPGEAVYLRYVPGPEGDIRKLWRKLTLKGDLSDEEAAEKLKEHIEGSDLMYRREYYRQNVDDGTTFEQLMKEKVGKYYIGDDTTVPDDLLNVGVRRVTPLSPGRQYVKNVAPTRGMAVTAMDPTTANSGYVVLPATATVGRGW